MQTTGNTILITGAGTGMGLEAAKQFSQRGFEHAQEEMTVNYLSAVRLT